MTINWTLISFLFGGGVLIPIITWVKSKFKKNEDEITAIKLGIQAILRDRLLNTYTEFNKNGGCSINEKMNWENMYNQYHALGSNGVMDGIRDEILHMSVLDDDK